MYYQQQTTKLEGIGPMPLDPGPDIVCRMAARSFAQVCVREICERERLVESGCVYVCVCDCVCDCVCVVCGHIYIAYEPVFICICVAYAEGKFVCIRLCSCFCSLADYYFLFFCQARVQYMKDLKSGKNKGMATMAWVRTLAAAHSNGC
jgi:hypothetical protein